MKDFIHFGWWHHCIGKLEFLLWTYTLAVNFTFTNSHINRCACTSSHILCPFPFHGHPCMEENSLGRGLFELEGISVSKQFPVSPCGTVSREAFCKHGPWPYNLPTPASLTPHGLVSVAVALWGRWSVPQEGKEVPAAPAGLVKASLHSEGAIFPPSWWCCPGIDHLLCLHMDQYGLPYYVLRPVWFSWSEELLRVAGPLDVS